MNNVVEELTKMIEECKHRIRTMERYIGKETDAIKFVEGLIEEAKVNPSKVAEELRKHAKVNISE